MNSTVLRPSVNLWLQQSSSTKTSCSLSAVLSTRTLPWPALNYQLSAPEPVPFVYILRILVLYAMTSGQELQPEPARAD